MSGFYGNSMQLCPLGAPGVRSSSTSRAAAVTVQANKLIKGANRPNTSKKAGSVKKGQLFELNLQKLCTDTEYIPSRQVGPVEVTTTSGGQQSWDCT